MTADRQEAAGLPAVFELTIQLAQGHFSLDIDERIAERSIALFGPSGSGKTTAVEAVAGLRTPYRGRIVVAGQTLYDATARVNMPPRDRRIGYVPQDVLLFPHLTVRGNVTYGAPRSLPDRRLLDLLELDGLIDRGVDGLSGGERQRVALARALHASPRVLLLDEPLAAVDLAHRRRIVEALLRIRDEMRLPIVYVTHSPEEADAIAERVLRLERGRVVNAEFRTEDAR